MKKQSYIKPQAIVLQVGTERLFASSNEVEGNGIHFNKNNMDSGDGSDAATKGASSYSVWDDDWRQ